MQNFGKRGKINDRNSFVFHRLSMGGVLGVYRKNEEIRDNLRDIKMLLFIIIATLLKIAF